MGCGSSNGQKINEEFVIKEGDDYPNTSLNTTRKSRSAKKNSTEGTVEHESKKRKEKDSFSQAANEEEHKKKVRRKRRRDTKTVSKDKSLSPERHKFKEKAAVAKETVSEIDAIDSGEEDDYQDSNFLCESSSRMDSLFFKSCLST